MSETKNITRIENAAEDESLEKTQDTSADIAESDYRHTFSKPFRWMEKTYETLDFNFGKLKGKDALAIYAELQAKGTIVVSPRMSQPYQVCLAAKACGLGTDAFEEMPLKDFETIIAKARNFIPSVALF